jgi:hypothetical protein
VNRNTKSRKENPKNTDNSRHKTKNESKQYKNTTQKMSNTDPLKNPKNKQIKLGLEEFEDTKEVIRIRISKKNRQHNGRKKRYKRTKVLIIYILYN